MLKGSGLTLPVVTVLVYYCVSAYRYLASCVRQDEVHRTDSVTQKTTRQGTRCTKVFDKAVFVR